MSDRRKKAGQIDNNPESVAMHAFGEIIIGNELKFDRNVKYFWTKCEWCREQRADGFYLGLKLSVAVLLYKNI